MEKSMLWNLGQYIEVLKWGNVTNIFRNKLCISVPTYIFYILWIENITLDKFWIHLITYSIVYTYFMTNLAQTLSYQIWKPPITTEFRGCATDVTGKIVAASATVALNDIYFVFRIFQS
jgi:hypothetical protein